MLEISPKIVIMVLLYLQNKKFSSYMAFLFTKIYIN